MTGPVADTPVGPVKARKRPLVVDTFLYTGNNADDIVAWAGSANVYTSLCDELIVRTPEGDHVLDPGDRVILGLVGEWYMIKPDAWAAGYDEVPA